MKFHISVGIAVLVGSACFSPGPDTLCLDPTFTTEEREQIGVAVGKWHDLSGGHVNVDVSCQMQAINVHRVTSSYPGLAALDEKYRGSVLGFTGHGHMYLVVDRIHGNLRQVVQHETGHFIGLRWPECEPPRDCDHVDAKDGPAIMTMSQSGATEFTDADLAFCRAGGLCP